MGRQTQVAMTDVDEGEFLAFLRSAADIQIFESSAPSPAAMPVEGFAPREEGHWQYFIWNLAFPWTPEYETVGNRAVCPDRAGWSYLRNASTAPVLEYDRHDFTSARAVGGRVYWARHFGAGTLAYDTDAFSRWFDRVVRWIRRRGRQQRRAAREPYFMPDAWSRNRR
jgi:hypothetical protein